MNHLKLFAVVAFSLASSTAVAGLITDEVQHDRFVANYFHYDQQTATVTAGGPEFTTSNYLVDVGDNSILFDWVGGVLFTKQPSGHVLRILDLDWVGNPSEIITGIDVTFGGQITNSLEPTVPQFSASNVSFTDRAVQIDVSGLFFGVGSFVDIGLQTNGTPNVPEPSSIALLLVGGIGLVGYGWRKRRQV